MLVSSGLDNTILISFFVIHTVATGKTENILGLALGNAIRKNDYGIRLGGDEFCLVLIDYSLTKSRDVIARAQEHLLTIDKEKLVAFS